MARKVTIKDLASKAGVSIGTVSRAINGHPSVRHRTRERILRIAKEMNFVPNAAARQLVRQTGDKKGIGLLLPVMESQYLFEVIKGIYTELKPNSYNITIFNTDHGHDKVIHNVIEQRLSAALILGDPALADEDRGVLEFHRIPFLYVDHHDESANFVTFDGENGGSLAANHLIDLGCKNIMLVGRTEQTQQQHDRFAGFKRKASESEAVHVSEVYVNTEDEAYRISLIFMNERSIDGLFYFSDTLAYGGLQARIESGSSVAIVGYDDIFPSKFMRLTTVQQSASVLGKQAADGVMKLIETTDTPQDAATRIMIQQNLPPKLVVRS